MGNVSIDPRTPTRKQLRESTRAQRRAAEQARDRRSALRRRLRLLGTLCAVVIAGTVAIVITSSGAASKAVVPGGREARQAVAEINALLSGTRQSGNVLGQPTAPVTLQYFGDLQCPVCRAFTQSALPPLVHKWVDTGRLRIEYRSLRTATREPEEFAAQQSAALAAGKQDRMWNFLEIFYREQQEEGSGYVTESFIRGIAGQVPGLKAARWAGDRADPTFASRLASDAQAANSAGLNGTPGFLIGRTGGAASRFEPTSFTDAGSFDEAIEKLASR